jgi:hypothetical protein
MRGQEATITAIDPVRQAALVEYVQAHRWIEGLAEGTSEGDVIRLASRLADPKVSEAEKKYLLILFAHIDGDPAFAAIECFVSAASGLIGHFARYALDEARSRRITEPAKALADVGEAAAA